MSGSGIDVVRRDRVVNQRSTCKLCWSDQAIFLPWTKSPIPSELILTTQTGVSDIPLTANGERMVKEMAPRMVGNDRRLPLRCMYSCQS